MYIITNSSLCCFVIPVVSAITIHTQHSMIQCGYVFDAGEVDLSNSAVSDPV